MMEQMQMDMDCNKILQNQTYQECLARIECCEKDRIFCHHDMGHFLDVARLAMIFNLQDNLGISHRVIYGTALLHDIGRHIQYDAGTPHELASAEIAPGILQDCGYLSEEIEQIIEAIRQHRNSDIRDEKSLRGIIYRADKMSRSCFTCKAESECHWKDDKKNLQLYY